MKQKCKNCVHHSWTIEGDAWCGKQMHYTNEDGCCNLYESEGKAALLAAVVLGVLLVVMIIAVKCCI